MLHQARISAAKRTKKVILEGEQSTVSTGTFVRGVVATTESHSLVVALVQDTRVLIKLEMQNPGGSVKDRIAKAMVEAAEAEGKITPGKSTVVEYTSGNTGIGLAMVCAAKGYDCILVMPQLPPFTERYVICRQFGAQVKCSLDG